MSLISKETLLTHLQRAEMASDVKLPIEFFRDLLYQAMPDERIKTDGFMYSYIARDGQERMLASSFGLTKSKAKKYINAQNNLQRLEPVQPHKLYEVSIFVGDEVKLRSKNT
jgi:hypothetical protein